MAERGHGLNDLLDIAYQGRWITITTLPRAAQRKTDIFEVVITYTSVPIAQIRWYSPWRAYAFFPCGESAWEEQCLQEIAAFLVALKRDKKASKTKKANV